jgi:formylglycine-generating enzyme required for sulfatase activity
VRGLRLFTYNFVYRDMGNCGFGHLATPGVDGPWEPRYILGTVPVKEDGSALFKVPANTPITVQPIDEQGRALQQMRSWFTAMPGETVSCIGCHAPQRTGPPANLSEASVGAPDAIEPWRGDARGFDFEIEVQPVLDRYCVGCHDGTASGRPDLARKSDEEKLRINREYVASTESTITTTLTPAFIALHPYVRRAHAESQYGPQVAAEFSVTTSPLIQILQKGHHGVRLDGEAWDRLYTWIDLGAPDQGSWRFSEWGVPSDYYERRKSMLAKYGDRMFDVEAMPGAPAGHPSFQPPPEAYEPRQAPECPGWPFGADDAGSRVGAAGRPAALSLPLGDGRAIELRLIPAGDFVMGDPNGADDEGPPSVVHIDKPFYMATTEVSNAQFAAVCGPEHNSGIEGWRSIDQRGEGYPLSGPDQPVVRVSWQEAMDFCRTLSAKLGREVLLPTEAEWEWACRAGTETPMWYGGLGDDFSKRENLAGSEQRDFAFSGKHKWFLRDDRYNDGAMVTAPVGSYGPGGENAFGLCDMAGNVSEWTLSAYAPYPYRADDGRNGTSPEGEKVVRGGSWFDRQERARSAFRWHYPAWQGVHNVGFRVIIPAE